MRDLKGKELHSMQNIELRAKYSELKDEHFNLRYQMAIGQCSNPARFKQVRRDLARVLSVAKERGIELR